MNTINKNLILLIFYLGFILSSPESMEIEKTGLSPQEKLQEIVERTFPPVLYKTEDEYSSNDKDYWDTAKAGLSFQTRSTLFQLPIEIIREFILPCMDAQTLYGRAALSCKSIYYLIKMSSFTLNDYCLTESRPHFMPPHILDLKTRRTKDGLLKLAALVSVSPNDLLAWFDRNYLQFIFTKHKNRLLHVLKGSVKGEEENAENLLPLLKIGMAATEPLQGDQPNPDRELVMQTIQKLSGTDTLSIYNLAIIYADPIQRENYYKTLKNLLSHFPFAQNDKSHSIKHTIARKLLRAVRDMILANQVLEKDAAQKANATEILQWCISNPSFIQGYEYSPLTSQANRLNCKHLIPDIFVSFSKLTNIEDDNKISFFQSVNSAKLGNSDIDNHINNYSKNLYSTTWQSLEYFTKISAIGLLIHAQMREEVHLAVNDVMLNHTDNIFYFFTSGIAGELAKNFPNETGELLDFLFTSDVKEQIFISTYLDETFFNVAIKHDKQKTKNLLKAIVDHFDVDDSTRLESLILLAKHVPEENAYIRDIINHSSVDKNNPDINEVFCKIYYYLNDREATLPYYEKMLEKLLDREGTDKAFAEKALKKLRKWGLSIEKLSDLKTLDCFDVLEATYKTFH